MEMEGRNLKDMEMVSENKIRPLLNSVGAFAQSPRQPQPPHAAASSSATAQAQTTAALLSPYMFF